MADPTSGEVRIFQLNGQDLRSIMLPARGHRSRETDPVLNVERESIDFSTACVDDFMDCAPWAIDRIFVVVVVVSSCFCGPYNAREFVV